MSRSAQSYARRNEWAEGAECIVTGVPHRSLWRQTLLAVFRAPAKIPVARVRVPQVAREASTVRCPQLFSVFQVRNVHVHVLKVPGLTLHLYPSAGHEALGERFRYPRDVVLRSCTLQVASCNPIPVQSCCASAKLLVNDRDWPLPSSYNCPLHQDTQEHDIVTHIVVLRKNSQ